MSVKDKVRRRLTLEPTPVPEWGEDVQVIVRGITLAARMRLTKSLGRKGEPDPAEAEAPESGEPGESDEERKADSFVICLAQAVCDVQTGRPIWTPEEMREVIETDDTGGIDRIAGVFSRRSGMSRKSTEKAERDFPGAPNSAPSSTSPNDSAEPSASS